MRNLTFLLLSILLALPACGDDSGGADSGVDSSVTDSGTGADSAMPDSGTNSDSGTASDSAVADGGSDASVTDSGAATDASGSDAGLCTLPSFERGCGATPNCIVAVHQVDCCGTLVAMGMNHSERDRFDTFESACAATYPACGCAARETMADDGTTGGGDATVSCVSGVCTTSFAP